MSDSPMRVLHVVGRMDRGGAETMIMNLYRNIERSKVQFDFAVHTEEVGEFDEEIISLGGRIYRFPRYRGSNHLAYVRSWHDWARQNDDVSVVHGHLFTIAGIYLRIVRRSGRATIAHSHATSHGVGPSATIKDLMRLTVRGSADFYLACSRDAARWLYGERISRRSDCFVVKNAIETDTFTFDAEKRIHLRSKLGLGGVTVVGHAGRFEYDKNHHRLISVFTDLVRVSPDAKLLLLGDGTLRREIEIMVQHAKLASNVIFLGSVANVSDYLQAMDVFVLPSHHEGLGIVIIEAQASGLPCVVSTTVPAEAFITPLVQAVSLEEPNSRWVDEILRRATPERRISPLGEIAASGYDASQNAQWYEIFYLGLKE